MTDVATTATERLAGPDELILVEAPAGHGKTWQAIAATGALSDRLERGQQVMLLSHTNTAKEEVKQRFGGRLPARVQTIDSLACEIVGTYTARLGIPKPFRPGSTHLGQPDFPTIRRLACELLREAPAIARGLAWRYPVVFVDEHQDSTHDQHELIWRIFRAGDVRLRLFGDPMQAIFGRDDDLVDWPSLVARHGSLSLTHGYRWDGQPELRDFMSAMRSSLLTGKAVDLRDAPRCVRVHRWEGQAPAPKQPGHCPHCLAHLRRLRPSGHVAYLVSNRAHSHGLAVKLATASLFEAGDVDEPLKVLEQAQAETGNAPALALVLAETLSAWGTGIHADLRNQLKRAAKPDGIDLTRRKRLIPLATVCDPIFADPTIGGFLNAFRAAVSTRDDLGWKPVRRDATFMLLSIPTNSEDPLLDLGAVAQAHRGRAGPRNKIMTIHKSKGREFDHVVLPYASSVTFPSNSYGSRLAYVSLSRAQHQIDILMPSKNPTDLLRQN